jgi:hypothetical protein
MSTPYLRRALALQEHVQAYAAAPFEWGRFDCCVWAADWVRSQKGQDPMYGLRGLQSARDARMGSALAPMLAQLGDVVLMPTARGAARAQRGLCDALGYTVGVCMGDHIAVPALRGLAFVPLAFGRAGSDVLQASGVAAWRV